MYIFSSLLGFTDSKTDLQKNRINTILSKKVKYIIDDSVITGCSKDVLINIVFEYGYNKTKTEIQTISEHKTNLEYKPLKHPKTHYYIVRDSDNTSYEVNKTEYDYINYVLASFNSIADIINYDSACNDSDISDISHDNPAKSDFSADQPENDSESKKNYEKSLEKIAESYIETNIYKICKDIFESTMKMDFKYPISTLKLAAAIKTIDNPYSKEYIIDCIKPIANKASRKIFSELSGYNLISVSDVHTIVYKMNENSIAFPEIKPIKSDVITDNISCCLQNIIDESNYLNPHGKKSGIIINRYNQDASALMFLTGLCIIDFKIMQHDSIDSEIVDNIPETNIDINIQRFIDPLNENKTESYKIAFNQVENINNDSVLMINNYIAFNTYVFKNIMMILKNATIEYYNKYRIARIYNDDISAYIMPININNNSKKIVNINLEAIV